MGVDGLERRVVGVGGLPDELGYTYRATCASYGYFSKECMEEVSAGESEDLALAGSRASGLI